MWSKSIVSMLVVFSTYSFAGGLECNSSQTKCVTHNSNLTVGDKVGFFNNHDELVAVGQVKKMHGSHRSLKVIKSYGRIHSKNTVALLGANVNRVHDAELSFNVYKPKPEMIIGANFGVTTLNVGEYLAGSEASVYGQWKYNKVFDYTLRTTMAGVKGRIGRSHDLLGVQKEDMDVISFSVLPGVSATAFRRSSFSIKGELNVGTAFVNATIADEAELVAGRGFNSKMNNGLGLAGRAAVSGQVNFDTWTTEVVLSQSLIHSALATTIALGQSHSIK